MIIDRKIPHAIAVVPPVDKATLFIDEAGNLMSVDSNGNVVSPTGKGTSLAGTHLSNMGVSGNLSNRDTELIYNANIASSTANVPLYLPAGRFRITSSLLNILHIEGVGPETVLVLDTVDISSSTYGQSVFQNVGFSVGGYNETTSRDIVIKNLSIEYAPNQNSTLFRFANTRSLLIENVTIKASSVINTNAVPPRPFAVDALIDVYASCKNVTIRNNYLANETFARGAANPWAPGGGGVIWVRNLVGSAATGAVESNATENVRIYNNTIISNTSDEALSVYGVVGLTRKVKVFNNTFSSPAAVPENIAYHSALISVFPLKHAMLGANAAVEDVDIHDNTIVDKAWFYSVIRFGNTTDTNAICRRVRSYNNNIIAYRSDDAVTGPLAVWEANGSTGNSPATSSQVLRGIRVTNAAGSGMKSLGYSSENDTIVCDGVTSYYGIVGMDKVTSPTLLGSIRHGIAYSYEVNGGDIQAIQSGVYNCNNVVGGNYAISGTTVDSAIMLIDGSASKYQLSNASGSTSGTLVRIQSFASNAPTVTIFQNNFTMNTSTAYILSNQLSTARVFARMNTTVGTVAGISQGTNIVTSLNVWDNTVE